MNIEAMSGLSFFMVEKYSYKEKHVCDFSNIPRPHFCMGLIFKGHAVFIPENGKEISLSPGDIIFVPITSRYVSHWKGDPDVFYISFHFCFDSSHGFSEKNRFALQKITLPNFNELKEKFTFSAEHYNSDDASKLQVLSLFYGILGELMPLLTQLEKTQNDIPIERAIKYLNLHSEENISVNTFAEISGMSLPNFYIRFRKYTGMTPIEYKNRLRITRAMRLLQSNQTLTVEEISSILGFDSPSYFRRVFKKATGEVPIAFRNRKLEL